MNDIEEAVKLQLSGTLSDSFGSVSDSQGVVMWHSIGSVSVCQVAVKRQSSDSQVAVQWHSHGSVNVSLVTFEL